MYTLLVMYTLYLGSLGRSCPTLQGPDIEYFDIKLSDGLKVPTHQTFYVCQQFKIPGDLIDDSYHMVGFSPLIDNEEVMHHMILFGCTEETPPSQAHSCGGTESTCRSFLTVWSLGFDGDICLYPKTGISMGRGGYQTLSLQVHWNNARQSVNLTDASGIRIHYTRTKRVYELGNVQIGQNDIEIPMKSTYLEHSGSCSQYCISKTFTRPFYITSTFLHMHSLGVRARLDHYRNGALFQNIAYDHLYDYNKPSLHNPKYSIKILPGDEIKMTCWFSTSDSGEKYRNRTIYWGEGVEGEMCYAFVSYFPKAVGFDQCVQYADFDQCDNYNQQTMIMGDCDFKRFMFDVGGEIGMIRRVCNENITPKCDSPCAHSIRTIYKHPCMQGRLAVFLEHRVAHTVNWEVIHKLHRLIMEHCPSQM